MGHTTEPSKCRGSASRDLHGLQEGTGGHLVGLGGHKSCARLRMTPSSRVGRGCAHGERAGEADLGLCGWHCPHRPHLGLVVRTGSVLLRPVPALGFVWRSPSGRGLGCGSRGPERFGAQGAGMRFCTLRAVRAAPATCPQEEAIGFVRAVPNEQNCPLLHEPFPSFLPSFPQCSVPEEPGARGRVRSAARHRALVVASEPAPARHWGQLQASWPSRGFCCREHSSAGRRAEGFTELFVSPPGQGGSQEAGGRALPDRRGASACPGRIRGGQLG